MWDINYPSKAVTKPWTQTLRAKAGTRSQYDSWELGKKVKYVSESEFGNCGFQLNLYWFKDQNSKSSLDKNVINLIKFLSFFFKG